MNLLRKVFVKSVARSLYNPREYYHIFVDSIACGYQEITKFYFLYISTFK